MCPGSALKRFRWAARKVLMKILSDKEKFRDVVRLAVKGKTRVMHNIHEEALDIASRFDSEQKKNQLSQQQVLEQKLLEKRRMKLRKETVLNMKSTGKGGGETSSSTPMLTPKQKMRRALVRLGILRDHGESMLAKLAKLAMAEDRLNQSHKSLTSQRLLDEYVVSSAMVEQKAKDAKKQQEKAFQEKLKKKKQIQAMKNMLGNSFAEITMSQSFGCFDDFEEDSSPQNPSLHQRQRVVSPEREMAQTWAGPVEVRPSSPGKKSFITPEPTGLEF